ncbi:hypothetical protein AB0M29_37800 [Streptomyces sp. NPDC051976]|uniref:hypothetical protein n=1 Tax=Streptomyces sp. NPDC051976 TaxID=3154947 RepID=UPI00342F6BFB
MAALGGALSTIFVSFFAACTRRGQRALAHVLSYPQRRRAKGKARAAQPGGESRAWLTSPGDGDMAGVGGEVTVEGRVLDQPADHDIWIVHRIPHANEIWPKERLAPDPAGWFRVTTLEGGSARSMAIVLLLTPAEVSRAFDDWMRRGRRTGHYPSLPLPSSAQVLTSAVVRGGTAREHTRRAGG